MNDFNEIPRPASQAPWTELVSSRTFGPILNPNRMGVVESISHVGELIDIDKV